MPATIETIAPTERDTRFAHAGSRVLARLIKQIGQQEEIHLRSDVDTTNNNEITLPANLARIVHDVLEQVGKGQAVVVLPLESEVTTSQAAEIIGVSRPFLVELLEQGDMQFHLVGTHRRVRLADVLTYRQERERRLGAIEELVAETDRLAVR